jgi:hypothetical protein
MKAFPTAADNGHEENQDGMDLRDYFAAKAMQAMIGQCEGGNFDDFVIAKQAYQMADFMIKERGQNDR